jgi:hypothetical protein
MRINLERATGTDDDKMSPVVPDLLPSQYFDRTSPRLDLNGARRLTLAVLEDAIHLFITRAGARDPCGRALFGKTEAWFEDTDSRWLFSFERICAVLDLDPDYLRRGLRARRPRAGAVHGTDRERPQPTTAPRRAGKKAAAA